MRERTSLLGAIVVLLVTLTAIWFAAEAEAHHKPASWPASAPGIHKVCSAVGLCHDKAAWPGPDHECNVQNSGEVARVWDARLGAFVIWRCMCYEDGCRWLRIRIEQRDRLPWETYCYRQVIDFHRACASIICKYVAVEHRYAVKGGYFVNC